MTQGATQAEALKNINEVVQMIVDELPEDGIALPTNEDVEVFDGTQVVVTVCRRCVVRDRQPVARPLRG